MKSRFLVEIGLNEMENRVTEFTKSKCSLYRAVQ